MMSLTRMMVAGLTLLPAAALPAVTTAGSTYPDKPIRLIVAVPAGGAPDIAARMIAPSLSAALGQQFVIDNRGGAGGLIAAELAAKAVPDGYTLFITNPPALMILPLLQKQASYNAVKDFAPVGLISSYFSLLVSNPTVPVTTVRELVALAKAEPNRLNYGSAGTGSITHLAMELFKSMAGVSILHVPYKGAPQALTDLLGGQVALNFSAISLVLPHVKTGRLRLLGISNAHRSALLPDAPTISESGVPGYSMTTWVGMLAPTKTPAPILARLNDALAKVVRTADSRTQFAAQGAEPVGNGAAEFAAFIRTESEKYAKVVKLSGMLAD